MAATNILVVEDQRAVAGALRMRLRGLGYDVAGIAKDGPEAIAKAQELRPDLILMDIRLGEGMDGIEAAQLIRDRFDIPVVYVTAYADRDLLDRARATEPAGFINKPFTTKDLLTTLRLALDRRGGTRAASPQGDAVLTTDLNGRITFANRAAVQATGWARESLVGQPLAGLLHALYGLDAKAAAGAIAEALRSGQDRELTTIGDCLVVLRDASDVVFGVALRFGIDSVRASLAALERFGNASRFLFDQLPLAVMLVDDALRLEYINGRAGRLLEEHSLLARVDGQLVVADANGHEQLAGLVERAARRATARPTGNASEMLSFSVVEEGRGLVLVALPVPSERGRATVALLAYEQPSELPLSAPVLRQMYGLTRAEVNLVQALARGRSLEEAAAELEISVNTARTHLKHIFHKTGARRQAELIHQIETGPATLPLTLALDQPAD